MRPGSSGELGVPSDWALSQEGGLEMMVGKYFRAWRQCLVSLGVAWEQHEPHKGKPMSSTAVEAPRLHKVNKQGLKEIPQVTGPRQAPRGPRAGHARKAEERS